VLNNGPTKKNRAELESAFHLFNQCAENLTRSYQALEKQVVHLNSELDVVKGERLQQLAEKERLASRLSDLLSALPAGVVVIDGTGTVREYNPAAEELLGTPLLNQPWRDIIHRSFKLGEGEGSEAILRDGRIVSISTCPLGKEPGQIIHLLDITENHHLQNSLAHYKKLSSMGEMSAKIAHQIRTPLSAALLYTSQLSQNNVDLSMRFRLSEKLMSRLKHMEQVIEDMLAFSRNGCGELESVSVSDLIEDFRQNVDGLLETSGARLYVKEEVEGVSININRHALISALQNLLVNSIQLQGEHTEIWLSTRRFRLPSGQSAIDIVVKDNGPGVPSEIQEKIFEPFFTTRAQGTGLGLAVTKAIVESSGGRIFLDTTFNHGASFVVRLMLTSESSSLLTDTYSAAIV